MTAEYFMKKPTKKGWIAAFFALICLPLLSSNKADAFDDNVTPYDPESFSLNLDTTRSSSRYFILDAQLPKEFQHALDDRQFIGVTGFSMGAITNSAFHNDAVISANDVTLMERPDTVCSSYDSGLCYNVKKFYSPHIPQVSITGLFALDGSTMLQWGINTGFDSEKLTVSPSIMLGLAKRFYFSDARDSHIIFEASDWFGGSVKHRSCTDDFNRQFFCGTVSAWSDFSYDSRPQSTFLKVTYEKAF